MLKKELTKKRICFVLYGYKASVLTLFDKLIPVYEEKGYPLKSIDFDFLKDKGYNPELVVVASNPEVMNELLRRKVLQNGFVHSDELVGLTNAVDLEYNMYGSMHEKVRVWYLNKPEYLSEVIKKTGTSLVRNDGGVEADSVAVVYYRGDCGEFLEYGV